MEELLIEPTEEEIEQKRRENEEFSKERMKHQINSTGESCPSCDHYPLEMEIMGFERIIFCTNCTYQRSEDM